MRKILIGFILIFQAILVFAQSDEMITNDIEYIVGEKETILDKASDYIAKKTKIGQNSHIFPIVGYNDNDTWMLGFNYGYHSRTTVNGFSYKFSPLYSFELQEVVGTAKVDYSTKISNDKSMKFSVDGKTYHEFFNEQRPELTSRYFRITPSVILSLDTQDPRRQKQFFINGHVIGNEILLFNSSGAYIDKQIETTIIPQIGFSYHEFDDVLTKNAQIVAEYQHYNTDDYYLKATAAYEYSIEIAPKKQFYVRTFISGHILNTQRNSSNYQNYFTRGSIAMIQQGFNDYTYSETFLARQAQDGFQNNQISIANGGGFKTAIGSAYGFAMSNSFAAAVNTRIDIPFLHPNLPLSIYFDAGTYSTNLLTGDNAQKLMFNGGLSLRLFDVINVYLPIVYSKNLHDIFVSEHDSFFSRVTFSIRPYTFNRKNVTFNQFF
ncbi:MAG: hypothetical protein R2774_01830 [Saprospiraceae bacterium]